MCKGFLQRLTNFYMSFYLDYKKDLYSEGNPCKTICCRNDLKLQRPSPGGCYDTKVRPKHDRVQDFFFFLLFWLAAHRFASRPGDGFQHGGRLRGGGGERADDAGRPASVRLGQVQQRQPPGPAAVLQLHVCQDAASSLWAMSCVCVCARVRGCVCWETKKAVFPDDFCEMNPQSSRYNLLLLSDKTSLCLTKDGQTS